MKKALIAMSGGVDSSLAALLTKNAGLECVGCTMKLYSSEEIGLSRTHTCCSLDDVADARSVAYKIGIPYYVFNFTEDFQKKVIDRFVCSYECGLTPNPCIDCNRFMKFDKLFDRAKILGCDYVVTGHYARIEKQDGGYVLKKALDETKDQSYVLYSMTQEQLAHTLFPLGNMQKSEVRRLAEENRFINAAKPDSQDICFVPDGDYGAFLERYTGKKYAPGPFLDTEGNVLGTHKGTVRYTIGQRKGLGIAFGKPMYVKSIDVQNNTVTLAENQELYSDVLTANEFHWISGRIPPAEVRCKAKIRYRHAEQSAAAYPQPDGKVKIVFDQPQRAITPGQAVVLYDGDVVLGGGRIM
ncbi:MAG: tRNA 2-thiouridine(34) synthase MnmA [Lachnospiraceae bacterium]|nr:tRNA 2-thiouridine(34) synthase MnmA [Lachnospiraceae bacterium]